MKLEISQTWNMTPAEAITLQHQLAARVERADRLEPVRIIAGADAWYDEAAQQAHGVVVTFSYPDLEQREVARAILPISMEYIPGLLSFREAPVLIDAMHQLRAMPDLLLVDGQGIAHPRRLGIASHLGVLLDLPTIGCAKSILRGKPGPIPDEVGAAAEMVDHGEVVGMALRTRRHANPMYISIGHRISLPTAVAYVVACGRGYRLPEPTRIADRFSRL